MFNSYGAPISLHTRGVVDLYCGATNASGILWHDFDIAGCCRVVVQPSICSCSHAHNSTTTPVHVQSVHCSVREKVRVKL